MASPIMPRNEEQSLSRRTSASLYEGFLAEEMREMASDRAQGSAPKRGTAPFCWSLI
jgi:hypothetical protein